MSQVIGTFAWGEVPTMKFFLKTSQLIQENTILVSTQDDMVNTSKRVWNKIDK